MGEIYGGHLVVKYLKEIEEVDTIFSLSGGHISRIYDGCREFGVRLIDVRHEQAAAMMAHAWSIYTGRPGVCLVTAGPGFTNALTGVVNAFMENAPMVVISGTAPIKDKVRGALQDIDQTAMICQSVKWHATCHDPRRLPEYLSLAFRHAVSGRPGPVYLELPPDVLNVQVDESLMDTARKGGVAYKSAPDPALLQPAADLINQAERPLIIGGTGVGVSDCRDALQTLIDKTGAPFMLLSNGRGVVPDQHPQSLWKGGFMALLTAAGQADLVLALGVRFNWLLMFGQVFPQAKVVRIDINPAEIDRNRPVDLGLAGDVGLALTGLNPLVEHRDRSGWLTALEETYRPMIQAEVEARTNPSSPIHPQRLVELVRQAVGDDALWVVDGGDTSYFGLVGLMAVEPAGVFGAAGGQFGCLGTGIPFGLAAKAARPDKNVVVINGDGSFGFNAMEFCTAVRHNLPILCVVNNDQAWGMIKHGQELCFGPDRLIGSELGAIHYEKMVEALGGYGEWVEKEEDLIPAVHRALASGRPACVNVMTDPCAVSLMSYQLVDGLNMEK